jgi:peptidoglycan/xylan/chitin deacetylase (PgdA/CDA1 family)
MSRPIDVVIFSSHAPQRIARLIRRIHRENPGVRVLGLLCQEPLRKEILLFDERAGLGHGLIKFFGRLGSALLRFIHACPGQPGDLSDFGTEDLARFCQSVGCAMLAVSDLHSPQALEFVRTLNPHLGIIYGTRDAAPELFSLPEQGSLLFRKGQVLSSVEASPPGYEELVDGRAHITISVHRYDAAQGEGECLDASTLPIGPFDTLTSLLLKTDLVGNDLLLHVLGGFVKGEVRPHPFDHAAGQVSLDASSPGAEGENLGTVRHLPYKPRSARPFWNMLLRTLLLIPWITTRNWIHRWQGSAPVIILYHHLVSDRPHYNAIPTELFLRHALFLKRHYRVVSLAEAVEALRNRRSKEPMVALTFDDGYAENFVNLRAVTEAMDLPTTLFVCTAHISEQRPFEHDRKRNHFDFSPLTWEQVDYLRHNGFEIGSHTRWHFNCGSTDVAVLEQEISGSRQDLEEKLGQSVTFFSFPWGQPENMSEAAFELAKANYPYVFSAFGGSNFNSRNGASQHLLRRDHSNNLWELELQMQAALGRNFPFYPTS